MPLEREGYRDTLAFLTTTKNLPMLINRKQACEVLGVSRDYLGKLIAKGEIKLSNSKITLGSLARYLCG